MLGQRTRGIQHLTVAADDDGQVTTRSDGSAFRSFQAMLWQQLGTLRIKQYMTLTGLEVQAEGLERIGDPGVAVFSDQADGLERDVRHGS